MTRVRHLRPGLLATLALSACSMVACGDDDPVAGSGDIVLATFESGGSGASGNPYPDPFTLDIRFGVADPSDPTPDDPDPLLHFEDMQDHPTRAIDDSHPDFPTVAARLTDGIDEIAYRGAFNPTGGGWGTGPESIMFEYSITQTGPDLAGFVVTRIVVRVDLEMSTSGPPWTYDLSYTGTIYGHAQ